MIYEMSAEDLDQVEGGALMKALQDQVINRLATGVVDLGVAIGRATVEWTFSRAPGGADRGTWESIGRSQMGA